MFHIRMVGERVKNTGQILYNMTKKLLNRAKVLRKNANMRYNVTIGWLGNIARCLTRKGKNMKRKLTKSKFAALFCAAVLSLTFLSSTAAAATEVSREACNHAWVKKLVETRQTVAVSNHECTICGAKINLYQDVGTYRYQCHRCFEWGGDPIKENVGGIYSTHPCYN